MLDSRLLIAPCGMNCGICIGYLREKNKCAGCNSDGENKPNSCKKCRIKNCEYLSDDESGFCYDCERYPCTRLKQLDKRYRTKYHMSMIENLNTIQLKGIDTFIELENQKWTCSYCNARLSAHRNECPECNERVIWES